MIHFGTTRGGRTVDAIDLARHGLTIRLLTYGAILQGVWLEGVEHSLTLGSGTLSDYEGAMRYHGSIVGPVANRIAQGTALIDGVRHDFNRNDGEPHTLHGGPVGTYCNIWSLVEQSQTTAQFVLTLPDGDGGFPGDRRITGTYEIHPGPTLRLTITTTSNKPTIANLTNHSYWNLDGSGQIEGHELKVAADYVLPTDDTDLVTGEVRAVANSSYDLRTGHHIFRAAPPLDHTFCVTNRRGPLRERLTLKGQNGITITVSTTEPGIHIFDARPTYNGLAIECQGWPDAPNNAHFPSIALDAHDTMTQVTEWRFG